MGSLHMVQSLHFMDLETAIAKKVAEFRQNNNDTPPFNEEELRAVGRYAVAMNQRLDYQVMIDEIQDKFNGRIRVYFAAYRILSDAKSLLEESKKHPPARYPDTLGRIGGRDPLRDEDPYRPRGRGTRRKPY